MKDFLSFQRKERKLVCGRNIKREIYFFDNFCGNHKILMVLLFLVDVITWCFDGFNLSVYEQFNKYNNPLVFTLEIEDFEEYQEPPKSKIIVLLC